MTCFRTGPGTRGAMLALALCGTAPVGTAVGQEAASLPSGAAKQKAMISSDNLEDLSPDAEQAIKDHFRKNFMLPDIVLWKFEYLRAYPTGGVAVCGHENAPNSTRQYTGEKPFFALFEHGDVTSGVVVARYEADPERASAKAYNIACGQSVP